MDYQLQVNEGEFPVKLVMTDSKVLDVMSSARETVADLKQKAFDPKAVEGSRVSLMFQGRELDDGQNIGELSEDQTGLYFNVVVSKANQEISFLPSPQPGVTDVNSPVPTGNVFDMVLWLVLGFFFHVVIVICVRLKQMLIGKTNKMQTFGGIIGVCVFVWFMLQFRVIH